MNLFYRLLRISGILSKMIPRFAAVSIIIFAICAPAFADDSAASIAAGGLVPRRETRIVMAKEVLRISEKKVIVDYDFRNDTDEDVTTEVAFPVPPYLNDWAEQEVSAQSFSDFQLQIDGKPALFKVEAKATLKGKDVSNILLADKIDIATFGHFKWKYQDLSAPDLTRLSKTEQKRLASLGLVDLDEATPHANWKVHLQYHWTQTFSARSTVHIRHEYSPVAGFQYMPLEAFENALATTPATITRKLDPSNNADLQQLTSFCPEPELLRGIVHRLGDGPKDARYVYPTWIDFILTTANTWQRPIEDFTLIVERPQVKDGNQTLISFCSPGPVEKLDADHFQVHLTNFIPKAELHIGFFGVPKAKSRKPKPKK